MSNLTSSQITSLSWWPHITKTGFSFSSTHQKIFSRLCGSISVHLIWIHTIQRSNDPVEQWKE